MQDPIVFRTDRTPTPAAPGAGDYVVAKFIKDRNTPSSSSPQGSPVFYDPVLSPSRSSSSEVGFEDQAPGETSLVGETDHMPGDGSGRQGRHGRRSRSHSTAGQPPTPKPPRGPPSHIYPVPSPSNPQENIHASVSPGSFQGGPPYHASPTPFYHRGNYVGQYTIPATQPPVTMGHTPSTFSYSHGFHHPGLHVPDSSMMPQTIHGAYQPLMQSHAPVYQYQSPSLEDRSSTQPPFAGRGAPSLYSQHHVNQSPPPHAPLSQPPGSQSGGHSPSFPGTGPFHSSRFPTSMTTPQYGYPPHSFPASPPMYRSQYGPPPYPQHFVPPFEQDAQGTWWYLPPAPVTAQQYEGQPTYQGHYLMNYSSLPGRPDVDGSYSQSGAGTSASIPSPYPHPPVQVGHIPIFQPDPELPSSSSSVTRLESPISVGKTDSLDGAKPVSDRPVVRRPYHPNAPAHRSEWVMWAGNVPSDTTHDELWRFFNQPLFATTGPGSDPASSAEPSSQALDDAIFGGVLSIFLISRSSCAFINFESESHLETAIARFNGLPLRPNDPRCPRLLCRVRKKGDDLKAGVGSQRGMGMHTRWIKDQKGKTPDGGERSSPTSSAPDVTPLSSSDQIVPVTSSFSLSSDDEDHWRSSYKGKGHSSSSGSYASTNSSVLTRYFPKRYFILKSLTQFDLNLSVEKGVWATQPHNEGVLDQAFRTSKDVYLIFGVNKSGEFYGYARMAGPVLQGEQRVSWATRTTESPPSSRSSVSPVTGRQVVQAEIIPEEIITSSGASHQLDKPTFLSPDRQVDESPLALPSIGQYRHFPADQGRVMGNLNARSAPAELGPRHGKVTPLALNNRSLDPSKIHHERGEEFELDAKAPLRAVRSHRQATSEGSGARLNQPLRPVEEEDPSDKDGPAKLVVNGNSIQTKEQDVEGSREEGWGESFKIEWLCTDRLPFFRARHIRNPWNRDREVKVSRDGTELEPSVGQKLLQEWSRLSEPQPSTGGGRPGASSSRRG